MRLYGASDKMGGWLEKLGMEEGEEISHPMLNRSIETAQKRVEQHHYQTRRRTLEYDDVMNKQREKFAHESRDAERGEVPDDQRGAERGAAGNDRVGQANAERFERR